jgi:hypothetical protein
MDWLGRWYKEHFKEFAESYIADIAKGVLVLLGLGVFRIAILTLKLTGMDPEQLALLEKLHFWSTYATIGALSLYSVIKVIAFLL